MGYLRSGPIRDISPLGSNRNAKPFRGDSSRFPAGFTLNNPLGSAMLPPPDKANSYEFFALQQLPYPEELAEQQFAIVYAGLTSPLIPNASSAGGLVSAYDASTKAALRSRASAQGVRLHLIAVGRERAGVLSERSRRLLCAARGRHLRLAPHHHAEG